MRPRAIAGSVLARIRGSAWSSRVIFACAVITAIFTALAVALRIRPIASEAVYSVLFVVMTAAALRRARLEVGLIALIVGGVCFYLAYLGYTEYGERNYD